MDLVVKLSDLFETYRFHDQALSLVGYNCSMLSGLYASKNNQQLAVSLKSISTQIVNARVILRLFDDASMLRYTISYGLGKFEKNLFVRVMTIVGNIASQFYYLFEHAAWLADSKLISFKSGYLWLASILMWLVSLLSSIVCNLIKLRSMHRASRFKEQCTRKQYFSVYLCLIKDITYAINCIHWLPLRFLWAGKLSEFTSGLLGVLAVSCNLLSKFSGRTKLSLINGIRQILFNQNTIKRSFSLSTANASGEFEWKNPKSEDEVVNITYVLKDGKEVKVRGKVGDNAMYLAHRYDIPLEGACEASLACSTCHVYVDKDYFDKLPDPLDEEEDMLDLAPFLKENSRLSCQITLKKDLEGMILKLPRATANFYVDGHVPEPH